MLVIWLVNIWLVARFVSRRSWGSGTLRARPTESGDHLKMMGATTRSGTPREVLRHRGRHVPQLDRRLRGRDDRRQGKGPTPVIGPDSLGENVLVPGYSST